jgi:hypothetical protein
LGFPKRVISNRGVKQRHHHRFTVERTEVDYDFIAYLKRQAPKFSGEASVIADVSDRVVDDTADDLLVERDDRGGRDGMAAGRCR